MTIMTIEQKNRLLDLSQKHQTLCDELDVVKKEIDDLFLLIAGRHFNFDQRHTVKSRIKQMIICAEVMNKLTPEEISAIGLNL